MERGRSLADHSPWGRKELDMTERLTLWLRWNLQASYSQDIIACSIITVLHVN